MLKTVWPARQEMTLGNLLTFRLEIELLSRIKNHSEALIYFQGISADIQDRLPYFREILTTSILSIHPVFCHSISEEVDWPPQDTEIEKWSYGSFKRAALLSQKTQQFPLLHWAPSIFSQAQTLLHQMSHARTRQVMTVHLKRQAGGPENSNAELEEWVHFFSEHRDKIFLLLGNDVFPSHLLLPNTWIANQLGISLPIQLALCAICDGFMGMAAGISTAACLSLTPYVIFKHPAHHSEEMKIELGDKDCLPFALPSQKILRKPGTLENLKKGLELLNLSPVG